MISAEKGREKKKERARRVSEIICMSVVATRQQRYDINNDDYDDARKNIKRKQGRTNGECKTPAAYGLALNAKYTYVDPNPRHSNGDVIPEPVRNAEENEWERN
jgi:hypothetical protein